MGSVDGRLCLQNGLRSVSGVGSTCVGLSCGIVQIGGLIPLLSPRSERFVCHCGVMEGSFVWGGELSSDFPGRRFLWV
jgi:hypothetical protein